MESPIRLAVFLSGAGTTLQNLIDRINAGRLAARIVLVVSSKPHALGVERARQAGLPLEVIEREKFRTTGEFSQALFDRCRQVEAELVLLAGFLKRLEIPTDFFGRVMNIHPALLPAFGGKGMYGRRVHQAVLESGVKTSGCTVHFVDNQYDHGPIILQRRVPVLDDDSPETLAARVFQEECVAYPEAIELFRQGRLAIEGDQVRIRPR